MISVPDLDDSWTFPTPAAWASLAEARTAARLVALSKCKDIWGGDFPRGARKPALVLGTVLITLHSPDAPFVGGLPLFGTPCGR